ncbi:MAG TPA: hypothetical protein VN886_11630, partial [Acidimicrobiales bacterium]|nr:hypothetical protein [Acidimicrobiales bacterium]
MRNSALVVLHRAHPSCFGPAGGALCTPGKTDILADRGRHPAPPGHWLPSGLLSSTRPPTRLVASSSGRRSARPLAAPLPRRAPAVP